MDTNTRTSGGTKMTAWMTSGAGIATAIQTIWGLPEITMHANHAVGRCVTVYASRSVGFHMQRHKSVDWIVYRVGCWASFGRVCVCLQTITVSISRNVCRRVGPAS
eukprot:GILJ01008408.1.p2 GENE.GILJ01008408.1~~GILJ01008408.1.p2  ORF type:complete len:106 (-),score=5.47 GILJ01008408.1:626-943(-)